ncbi:MAG: pimeloyl-ACP methyl ester carboxylesterase [Flavobacteriaceae bacterium]|jgi:pimeloyl-ACP methyl ester carboxylesterase
MKFILSAILVIAFALTSFGLNPSRTYKQLPDKYNMEYTAHKVKANDGSAELNIWYFPSAKEKTTNLVLIAHNGEGNMADYLRRVDQFTAAGYNVVTFDYRGYGESSDFEIDNNMYIYPHFQNDMETMIDWCRKQHVSTFNLYGWGMGAGLSLGVGWSRTEIKQIIADTPFLSMEDLEERFSEWDTPMEVPFAGYEKRFEPIYSLDNAGGKNIEKVLLIVGSNDVLYDKDAMNSLKTKQKKVIGPVYIVENPDRKDNFSIDKVAYFKQISATLGVK